MDIFGNISGPDALYYVPGRNFPVRSAVSTSYSARRRRSMNEDSMNLNQQRRQCEFDVEDRSSRQAAGFAAPYTCAVCGAEAQVMSNLCAPEFNPRATD
jgi:hypothetical protein